MDNWEKSRRQKRFRQKSTHDRRAARGEPAVKPREPRRKPNRPRFGPNFIEDDEEFFEDFFDEFEEFEGFSDSE